MLLEGRPLGASVPSGLARDYHRFMNALAPEVVLSTKAGLDRQEAVRAMRVWLTTKAPGVGRLSKPYAYLDSYAESQIADAVRVPLVRRIADIEANSLYADLAVFRDDDPETPHLAAVFTADLRGTEDWVPWQNTSVNRLVLFNVDEDGRLRRRAFGRSPDTHALIEFGSGS